MCKGLSVWECDSCWAEAKARVVEKFVCFKCGKPLSRGQPAPWECGYQPEVLVPEVEAPEPETRRFRVSLGYTVEQVPVHTKVWPTVWYEREEDEDTV